MSNAKGEEEGADEAEEPLAEPWVARSSRRGNRLSGKGQACELSAHHAQPPELRAFILGNNVAFIICEGEKGKKERRRKENGGRVGGGGGWRGVSHALNPARVGTICQP